MEKQLLAHLVIRDAIQLAFQVGAIGGGSGSGSGSGSTDGGGAVKSIKTGPAEVEFFDATKTSGAYFAAGAGSSAGKINNSFQSLVDAPCIIASRLKIPLYICPKKNKVLPPLILKK
jgi:hypothetical protein